MSLKLFQSSHPLARVKYILGIAAGKGGVGKSTVTANLALALKSLGFQVGVLDTDLYGPSLRRMLPEDKLPSQQNEILFPAISNGIKLISMAFFRREEEASAVRAPIANGLITQFLQNVDWGSLDFLLIDFPPGTGDIQLTLTQKANLHGALIVTTPQEVALMDVRKAMHLFRQVNVPMVGIVENMSYYLDPHTLNRVPLFGQGGGERLAHETGVPLLGAIPIDQDLSECCDRGQSIFELKEASQKPAVQAFLELAKKLASILKTPPKKESENLKEFELVWKEMNQ